MNIDLLLKVLKKNYASYASAISRVLFTGVYAFLLVRVSALYCLNKDLSWLRNAFIEPEKLVYILTCIIIINSLYDYYRINCNT